MIRSDIGLCGKGRGATIRQIQAGLFMISGHNTMIRAVSVIGLLLLQACAPSGNQPGEAAETTAQAKDVVLEEKGGPLQFHYAWPAVAAAVPTLNAQLQADADALKEEALLVAKDDEESRASSGFPFHPHEASKVWKVEGETPRLLALRGEYYEFTGGAHGMSSFEAILWDRQLDEPIDTLHLFSDMQQALDLVKQAFCPALNAEREKRRGEPVPPSAGPDDWMNGCPDLDQQVMIPSGVKNGAFTTIRVLIAPYEAGPYAEGTYEISVPITQDLYALALPEYAGSVAVAP